MTSATHWGAFAAQAPRGCFLREHTTAVSILDRLLHHATIVVISGESYRMRHADHKKRGTT
ncbi:hypothetical protein AN931_24065 [Mycobacterium intracellulare subsp. chimaera]|nr:hypothetical protein BWK49_01830 [Mycobacterium intracellulare subsp. chimaera]ETZ38641.1 istB ATP-binding domain protein [Mycobacterium intracellulare MIN_052511_1280]KPN45893.1 hypothetical protein AN933_26955 [Mycobacterium intracellulare subsp. chimaera]KPN47708.1 hypothetical protein AN931_24065 [Mycobacterium intracellulare subsp. chimaera]